MKSLARNDGSERLLLLLLLHHFSLITSTVLLGIVEPQSDCQWLFSDKFSRSMGGRGAGLRWGAKSPLLFASLVERLI